MKTIENEKDFKILKISKNEADYLGFGIGAGACICMHCNNIISGSIYFIPVLNDCMCKECYEKWYKEAENYPEDHDYEERNYDYIIKSLKNYNGM